MKRLCIETSGILNWQDRLAKRSHWKRGFSAFETAVSWEYAATTPSGLPAQFSGLFHAAGWHEPELMFAIAEHQVPLHGKGHDSQCDVWGLINSGVGLISLTVEAKAKEPFGNNHESLATWFTKVSADNGGKRWNYIRSHLPGVDPARFQPVAYQLLHRCAAAVIEARRLRLKCAAFVVQSFDSPQESYHEFEKFCEAVGVNSTRGRLSRTTVSEIELGMGWVDCPLSTDQMIARIASGESNPG